MKTALFTGWTGTATVGGAAAAGATKLDLSFDSYTYEPLNEQAASSARAERVASLRASPGMIPAAVPMHEARPRSRDVAGRRSPGLIDGARGGVHTECAMPPPPVPFFSGRSVTAWETEDGLFAVRPTRGHGFVAPVGTQVLYLPTVSLLRAEVRRLADPSWSAIEFYGEFRRVGQPSPTVLEAVASADADGLVRALYARFGLPRIPRPCTAAELRDQRTMEFVEVIAVYAPGHFEASDFEGLKLAGDRTMLATLVPGRRYRVIALFSPGTPRDSPFPRPVGYSGPYLHVQALAAAQVMT